MKTLIHFGMQKTGSTSIQQSLFHANLPAEFQYIQFGRPNSSAALATMFLEKPEEFYFNKRRGFTPQQLRQQKKRLLEKFESYLVDTSKSRALISSEDLSSLSESVIKGLRDTILSKDGEVEAAGYIRKPKSFLNSSLQERIKHGRRRFNVEEFFPRYRERFEKFDSVFGRERTKFWLYDPSAFHKNDVVLDFCHRVELPFEAANVRRNNESISLPALKLLYAYRKFSPKAAPGVETVRANTLLLKKLRELKGAKMTLASSLTDPIAVYFRDDLEWMAKRLGQSMAEDGEDAEDAIRDEKDLLSQDPRALEWLAEAIGLSSRKIGVRANKQVAAGMQVLRDQLVADDRKSLSGMDVR